MVLAKTSLPNANKNISEIIPVAAPVIGKFNDPIAHNLVFNSDSVASAIVKKPHDSTKSLNTRHGPNVESRNKEQLVIEKSTRLMKYSINNIFFFN